jgi:hypothetical protein
MPRKAVGLTAKGVQAAAPGRYGDGGGLYVLVRPGGARFWLFRYVINKRMREMGLGAASGRDAVTLANARIAARKLWEAVRANRYPLEDRNADAQAKQAAALAAQARNKTFRDVASLYIAAHEPGWRNAKHRAQWVSTLEAYAHPVMGSLPVADVETGHVMAVLEPMVAWPYRQHAAAQGEDTAGGAPRRFAVAGDRSLRPDLTADGRVGRPSPVADDPDGGPVKRSAGSPLERNRPR